MSLRARLFVTSLGATCFVLAVTWIGAELTIEPAALGPVRTVLGFASVLAIATALALAERAARSIAAPLAAIRTTAEALAEGSPSEARSRLRQDDELGAIG